MANAHIANLMWDAYAIQAGGKTFDGKPLPTWDELLDERQSCWIAAASVTADRIEKLDAVTKDNAKWLAAYHKWCEMNGCAPSSSDLIAVREALEEKDNAKWLAAYHKWCEMNGCAPSSSDLIASREALEEKDER